MTRSARSGSRAGCTNPSAFEQVVITRVGEHVVRLGQVARIEDGTEEPRSSAFHDGRPAVGIDIVKATEASTTAVSRAVLARVKELERGLPDGVQLSVVRDSGVRVERSVLDVESSLLEGAALTVLVVFLFLNSWRSTVITGLALPVSVLASFIAVKALGFTLNTMSLLGLSLAIGILIDDAIVVRENIVRHMQMGKDHVRAAREGTAEIGMAVAATTFSIVVVFVPVAFMGGVAQQWFAPFALTIACSVLVSLLVSFSLDPMLSSIWADPAIEEGRMGFVSRHVARFNHFVRARHRALPATSCAGRCATDSRWARSQSPASRSRWRCPRSVSSGRSCFRSRTAPSSSSSSRPRPARVSSTWRRRRSKPPPSCEARADVAYTYTTIGGLAGEAVDEASIYVRLHAKHDARPAPAGDRRSCAGELGRIAGLTVSIGTGGFGGRKQIAAAAPGSGPRRARPTRP